MAQSTNGQRSSSQRCCRSSGRRASPSSSGTSAFAGQARRGESTRNLGARAQRDCSAFDCRTWAFAQIDDPTLGNRLSSADGRFLPDVKPLFQHHQLRQRLSHTAATCRPALRRFKPRLLQHRIMGGGSSRRPILIRAVPTTTIEPVEWTDTSALRPTIQDGAG
jgi:hypothetical protein